jgi:tRNA pseudouridine38-40 synthase
LLSALNALAPEDITFKRVSEVDDDFHARFSAKSKTYRYVISKEKNIFKRNHELQYDNDLNIALIKKTFPFFVGEHDFKSFSTSDNEDTIRKINYIKLLKKDNEIIIEVNGSGFLRNMVRIIVASIIDVNEGKKD